MTRTRSTRLQHPLTLVPSLMVLRPRLLFLLRTLIQIQPQKVLPPVRVRMPTRSLQMVLLYPAPRIGLERLRCILKSVAFTGRVTTVPPLVSLDTMMMTSMIVQRERLLRKVELARLTSIPCQCATLRIYRAFAPRRSPPRRHLLLFL